MNQLIRRETRWLDPFDMLTDFHENINRLFSASHDRGSAETLAGFTPCIELREEGDKFLIHADVPGIDRKDIDIAVVGNSLTIQGERRSEEKQKEKGYYYTERTFGIFRRIIELPAKVDAEKTSATYKDGVLKLSVAKSEHSKPKQVRVEVK